MRKSKCKYKIEDSLINYLGVAAGHLNFYLSCKTEASSSGLITVFVSVGASGVTAAPPADQNLPLGGTAISSLSGVGDVAHQPVGSSDQSGAGGAPLSSGLDLSLASSLSGSSDSAGWS